MTGYWELKPSEDLDPYRCLEIDAEDVLEFVEVRVDDRKDTSIQEWEKEHIYDQIREGYVSGQWDSGD